MDRQPRGLASLGRVKRLKAATTTTHEGLDKRIMGLDPFAARERYGLFLEMQRRFHRDIDALYLDPSLGIALPALAERRSLPLIEQDMRDLGLTAAASAAPRFGPDHLDRIGALGWLYVAEGSTLGAAFLYKAALKLGLDAEFGARHLAAAPEGRAAHWLAFTVALDSLPLSEAEEVRVQQGAADAFATVRAHVEAVFG